MGNAGLMQILMMEVHNYANEHGWTNLNHGLCIITVMENNVMDQFYLTTQYGCVSINQVVTNDTQELLAKTRKAQDSMMLHKLLMGCLSSVSKNSHDSQIPLQDSSKWPAIQKCASQDNHQDRQAPDTSVSTDAEEQHHKYE